MSGHENVLKRLIIHAGGFNLGLFMRTFFGIGTPRGLPGRSAAIATLLNVLWTLINDARTAIGPDRRDPLRPDPRFVGSMLVGSFA